MTKLTRYLCAGYVSEMQQFNSGDWVQYEDVAFLEAELFAFTASSAAREKALAKLQVENDLLKSENARSRDQYNGIIDTQLSVIQELQSKVERLTKAGDLLAFHYTSLGRKFFPDDPLPTSINNWNATKEGKQP